MREWLRRLLCRLGLCREPELHYIGGSDTLPPPLSRERETELLNRLGEEAARQELIEHNLRLVVYIARRFENTGINIEDLISIGTIGLIKAVNTFRPDKKIKLTTYASRCIENEILMYFRSQRKLQGEVSLNEALDTGPDGDALCLSDVVGEEDTMLDQLQDKENRLLIRRLVSELLTPREADIIRRRYGLDGRVPQTQRQVAAAYHISRSYVSRRN